jgi:hypothetical protein
MTTTSQTTTYPLRAVRWAFVTLVGAILADLAETLVDPANSGKTTAVYAAAANHPTRLIVCAVLLLLTSLIVPAVWGLTRPLTGRGRVLGRLAAVLALMGALGHAALALLYLVWIQMATGNADREQMLALIDRINNAGSTAIMFPLIIAFPLALLALFGALVRARVASRWVLVPVVLAPLSAIFVPIVVASTGGALVCLLVATAMVVVGLRDRSRGSKVAAAVVPA